MTMEMAKDLVSAILLVATLALVAVIFSGLKADGAPACLSKSEARERWPHSHLRWNTAGHCWHDGRYSRRTKFRPRNEQALLARAKAPEPEDQCCWPALDLDASGNVAEPARPFLDRWNDQPWVR